MAATARPVALVTGAARRIGRILALDLASQGWDVAIHYGRSRDDAERVAEEARAHGVAAVTLAADLGNEDAVAGLFPAAVEALGQAPSLLVNNAAIFEYDNPASATRSSWDRHLETNLRAPFVLAQALAAHLPAGESGNIVNMLDQRVWKPNQHFTSYTVAKSGLWTLTRSLAIELGPQIRVNAIGPGPCLRNPRQSEAHFRRQYERTPLKRPSSPEEVAQTLRFILATPSLTGQMIALDSGEHLEWAGLAPAATTE